jgi:pimeloyl-ACP methyl ester carboxylesterase
MQILPPASRLVQPIRLTCRLVALVAMLLLTTETAPADEAPSPGVEDVVFSAECDKTEQRYVLVTPPKFDPAAECNLLIALHGHGSDRWQFVRETRGECRAARDVALENRMLFVSPDYRARTSWMGPKAEADLVQIIGALKAKHRVQKVIVSGGSMGGTSALTFAALHPELVDGVVSLNGMANHLEYDGFQDAIAESFGGPKAKLPEEYKRRSAEYWPEKLTMPLAATTGGRDTLVPPDSVRRLTTMLTKLGRQVKLIDRPEGGHETNYEDSVAAYRFVVEQLRKGP